MQYLPPLVAAMSPAEHVGMAAFQLDMLFSALMGLKAMEPDLLSIGVDPRSILAVGFRKQEDVGRAIRAEFPLWPEDPPVARIFDGIAELLFPPQGEGAPTAARARLARAVEVVRTVALRHLGDL